MNRQKKIWESGSEEGYGEGGDRLKFENDAQTFVTFNGSFAFLGKRKGIWRK